MERRARAPRVLLENPDAARRWADTRILTRAGYSVVNCPGPDTGPCPLLKGEGCPKTTIADVIVFSLGLRRPEGRQVLRALRSSFPDTPIIAEVKPDEKADHGHLLAGCFTVTYPVLPRRLVRAVGEALEDGDRVLERSSSKSRARP